MKRDSANHIGRGSASGSPAGGNGAVQKRCLKPQMKTRNSRPDVAFDVWRPRWGRLQERAFYAFVDGLGEATGEQIARYCWDDRPTERQRYSQRRACRSIGARPVRREGRVWIWRLANK